MTYNNKSCQAFNTEAVDKFKQLEQECLTTTKS